MCSLRSSLRLPLLSLLLHSFLSILLLERSTTTTSKSNSPLSLESQPLLIIAAAASSAGAEHRCILRDNPTIPVVIPPSQINDDYCDCVDGSDEPATAACPNGTFTCTNIGHRRLAIPSSRVRDGYCDCCDGSDEAAGACQNTCSTLHAAAVADAEKRAAHVRRGLARRAEYVAESRRKIREEKVKRADVKTKLAAVDDAIKRTSAKLEQLKARKKWAVTTPPPTAPPPTPTAAENADGSTSTESEQAHEEEEEEKDQDSADNVDEAGVEGDGLDEDMAPIHDLPETEDATSEGSEVADSVQHSSDQSHDGPSEEPSTDVPPVADHPVEESLETAAPDDAQRDQDEKTTEGEAVDFNTIKEYDNEQDNENHGEDEEEDDDEDHDYHGDDHHSSSSGSSDSGDDAPIDPATVKVESICASLDGEESSNAILRRIRYARNVVMGRLNRVSPKFFPVRAGSAISDLSACVSEAENIKWRLESRRRELEDEEKKLSGKDDRDYGSDGALRQLDGRCIKSKILQYEFEHCPFDLVRQYEFGNPIASLGKYKRTETDQATGQLTLIYKDGDTCWNGPVRSIKVHMLCGDQEEILSVDEPNRCSYSMKFRTPAVCTQDMVDKIMAEVNRSSDSGKDEL